MNKKQMLWLVLVLAVVGLASLLLLHRDKSSWQAPARDAGGKVLGNFDLNSVSAIQIKDASGTVKLAKKDGVWVVEQRDGYPADFGRVGDLIRKLWELSALQQVEAGLAQLGHLKLLEPEQAKEATGTLIDLRDASGKRVAALLAGKTYSRSEPGAPEGFGGMPVGRFVMALDGRNQPVLVKDALAEVVVKPEEWLDHTFLRLEDVQSLAFQNGAQHWTIQRATDKDPWTFDGLDKGPPANEAKVSAAAHAVEYLTFADVQAQSAPFEAAVTLTVKTFGHFTYTFQIGQLEQGQYPVRVSVAADFPKTRPSAANEKPEEKTAHDQAFAVDLKKSGDTLAAQKKLEGHIYLLPQSALDPIFVRPADFIQKPVPSPSPSAPVASPAHP